MKFDLRLEGYINNADVTPEEFAAEFKQWLEEKGYGYTGKVAQVFEDENVMEYLEGISQDKEDSTFLVHDDGSMDEE